MKLPATIRAGIPPSVAASIEWQTSVIHGDDGQFDGVVVTGASVKSGASAEDLRAALAAVEKSLRPCGSGALVVDALAPMIAACRNRPGEHADEAASVVVYGARLAEFPVDILQQAVRHFIDTSPWMPAISEILVVINRLLRPQHALKAALEAAIARIEAPSRPRIEAPSMQSDRVRQELGLVAQTSRQPMPVVEAKLKEMREKLEAAGFSSHQARQEVGEAALRAPKTPFVLVAMDERVDAVIARRRSPSPPAAERWKADEAPEHLRAPPPPPTSASMTARAWRLAARFHRQSGREDYARILEERADALEGKPSTAPQAPQRQAGR